MEKMEILWVVLVLIAAGVSVTSAWAKCRQILLRRRQKRSNLQDE